jgi:PHP family Zn ribbon phosphoesterase
MNTYSADLHIHTLLSPCGDLDMTPLNIVKHASLKKLDIIGITDHNSTLQTSLVKDFAAEFGIFVLSGVEITTKEEVHCLAYFEFDHHLAEFQSYMESHLPKIENNPAKFGYQVVIDKDENIVYEAPFLLINGLNQSLNQVQQKVKALNGLFIPAHVNRSTFSLTSQLGFIPPDLVVDALEVSRHITPAKFVAQQRLTKPYTFIQSSDAHFPNDIGSVCTQFRLMEPSFQEIRMALKNENGRSVLY